MSAEHHDPVTVEGDNTLDVENSLTTDSEELVNREFEIEPSTDDIEDTLQALSDDDKDTEEEPTSANPFSDVYKYSGHSAHQTELTMLSDITEATENSTDYEQTDEPQEAHDDSVATPIDGQFPDITQEDEQVPADEAHDQQEPADASHQPVEVAHEETLEEAPEEHVDEVHAGERESVEEILAQPTKEDHEQVEEIHPQVAEDASLETQSEEGPDPAPAPYEFVTATPLDVIPLPAPESPSQPESSHHHIPSESEKGSSSSTEPDGSLFDVTHTHSSSLESEEASTIVDSALEKEENVQVLAPTSKDVPELHDGGHTEEDIAAVAVAVPAVTVTTLLAHSIPSPDKILPEHKDLSLELAGEVPAVAEDTLKIGLTEELSPPPQIQAAEIPRTASPWTPSYSVSTLKPEVVEGTEDEPILSTEPTESPQVTEVPATSLGREDAAPPRSSSPWTPSYSVNTQGPAESQDEAVIAKIDQLPPSVVEEPPAATESDEQWISSMDEDLATLDVAPSTFQVPTILTDDQTAVDGHNEEVLPITVDTSTLYKVSPEPERPKSPWTPSYSVSRQGSIMEDEIVEEEDPANISSPAPIVNAEPTVVSAPEEIVAPVPVNATDEEASKLLVVDEVAVQEETITEVVALQPEHTTFVDASVVDKVHEATPEIERPKSPWTPSYSVSSQGPGAVDIAPRGMGMSPSSHLVATEYQNGARLSPEPANGVQLERPIPQRIPTITLEDKEVVLPEEPAALATQAPERVHTPTSEPERPWTPSYSVSNQGPGTPERVEPVALIASPVHEDKKELSPERPASPWTPSYSVITQSPRMTAEATSSGAAEPILASPRISIPPSPKLSGSPDNIERPKSPWTPSYSVSNQGPKGLVADEDIGELDQLPPPVVHQPTALRPDTNQSMESERPKSPWTPSYTVTKQGSQEHLTNVQTAVVEPQRSKSPSWNPSYSVTTQGSREDLTKLDNTAPTEPERPKSPWTPSYTVTKQGSTENLTKFSNAIVEQERPKSPWTPSYAVTSQGSSDDLTRAAKTTELLSAVDAPPETSTNGSNLLVRSYSVTSMGSPRDQSKELNASSSKDAVSQGVPQPSISGTSSPKIVFPDGTEVTAEPQIPQDRQSLIPSESHEQERPKSPWTPSYSVARQGSGLGDEEELKGLEQLPKRVLDIDDADVPAVAEEKPKLPPLRTGHIGSSVGFDPSISPVTRARKRLESNTSSRFFPGGWFSPKAEEGRTSLEIAAGEFTPRTPLELPVPPPTAIDPNDAPSKGRWPGCVVM